MYGKTKTHFLKQLYKYKIIIKYPSFKAGGQGGRPLYREDNFNLHVYFYNTNRGAHIYLAPVGNTLCSSTVTCNKLFSLFEW